MFVQSYFIDVAKIVFHLGESQTLEGELSLASTF